MGRRDRLRKQAIRHGQESSIKVQRQLDAVERIAEEYGRELVGQVGASLNCHYAKSRLWPPYLGVY